jgi:hypothetical protein
MCKEHRWKDSDRCQARRNNCLSVNFFTTNPIENGSGLNPGLRDERPKKKRLSHVTTYHRIDRWIDRNVLYETASSDKSNLTECNYPCGTRRHIQPSAHHKPRVVYRNYCAVYNVSSQQTYLLIICSNCGCALRGLPQRVQSRRGSL